MRFLVGLFLTLVLIRSVAVASMSSSFNKKNQGKGDPESDLLRLTHGEMIGMLIARPVSGAITRGMLTQQKAAPKEPIIEAARQLLANTGLGKPDLEDFNSELALLEAVGIVKRTEQSSSIYELTEKGRQVAKDAFTLD